MRYSVLKRYGSDDSIRSRYKYLNKKYHNSVLIPAFHAQDQVSSIKGNGKFMELKGCTGNNLKNVSVKFPLAKMIGVTGVSGSGKSTLINETLFPILNQHFYKAVKTPLPYQKVSGIDNVDKVIGINQSPIGRTPRSNPATYTGIFNLIRDLFTQLPEAKIRGYKAGRFSFNVKGGRCETCVGAWL